MITITGVTRERRASVDTAGGRSVGPRAGVDRSPTARGSSATADSIAGTGAGPDRCGRQCPGRRRSDESTGGGRRGHGAINRAGGSGNQVIDDVARRGSLEDERLRRNTGGWSQQLCQRLLVQSTDKVSGRIRRGRSQCCTTPPRCRHC